MGRDYRAALQLVTYGLEGGPKPSRHEGYEKMTGIFSETGELLERVAVPDVLPDIPGGQANLLPVAVLSNPLRVIVPIWPITDPREGEPESLKVIWDGDVVDSDSWTGPIPADDLVREIPQNRLADGQHWIKYLVTNGSGDSSDSECYSVVIDRTAPVLSAARGQLLVVEDPDEIEQGGLTDHYLDNHEDRLRVEIPLYDEPMPGDKILYYWDEEPDSDEEAGDFTLGSEHMGKPIYIDFARDLILARGNGVRYLRYVIEDRAGNRSAFARYLQLTVKVGVARTWPPVQVEQTTGAGASLALELDDFHQPLLVLVPDEAVVYPGESVRVIWGSPGDYGYYTTDTEVAGRPRHYEIPVEKLVGQSRTTISVNYQVEVHLPDPVHLQVKALSKHLPQVQLDGNSGNGSDFSLTPVRDAYTVSLGTWRLIAQGQRITIWATGVSSNGGDAEPCYVLDGHPVTASQAQRGIGSEGEVLLPRAFLVALLDNSPFTLHVAVSFDAGKNWINFPGSSFVLRK